MKWPPGLPALMEHTIGLTAIRVSKQANDFVEQNASCISRLDIES